MHGTIGIKTRCDFGVVMLLMVASSVTPGFAQPGRRLESPANRSLVVIVQVKPEMLGEWLDLQRKAVVPALKKAGVTSRTVYSSRVFGTAFEYRIVQPLNRFADSSPSRARRCSNWEGWPGRIPERSWVACCRWERLRRR